MSRKRGRGPKWAEIPKPINGQAALELSADLQQYAPDDFFSAYQMSRRGVDAASFLKWMQEAQERDE